MFNSKTSKQGRCCNCVGVAANIVDGYLLPNDTSPRKPMLPSMSTIMVAAAAVSPQGLGPVVTDKGPSQLSVTTVTPQGLIIT
eukprot:4864751-Amphidinium_carterae.1